MEVWLTTEYVSINKYFVQILIEKKKKNEEYVGNTKKYHAFNILFIEQKVSYS